MLKLNKVARINQYNVFSSGYIICFITYICSERTNWALPVKRIHVSIQAHIRTERLGQEIWF